MWLNKPSNMHLNAHFVSPSLSLSPWTHQSHLNSSSPINHKTTTAIQPILNPSHTYFLLPLPLQIMLNLLILLCFPHNTTWAENIQVVRRCSDSIAWKACANPKGIRWSYTEKAPLSVMCTPLMQPAKHTVVPCDPLLCALWTPMHTLISSPASGTAPLVKDEVDDAVDVAFLAEPVLGVGVECVLVA